VSTKVDPEQRDGIDHAYLSTQVEYAAHRTSKAVVERALGDRADRPLPPPVPCDTLAPLEERYDRLTRRTIGLLEASGSLGLTDWCDLIEFHAIGEHNASSRLLLLDWLLKEASSEQRALVLDSGYLRLPYVPPANHLAEARLAAAVRQHYRACTPSAQRRADHYVDLLDEEGGGLILVRDANGKRLIEPYVGTRADLVRAS
jgi:hypothetical protein